MAFYKNKAHLGRFLCEKMGLKDLFPSEYIKVTAFNQMLCIMINT